MGIEQSMIQKRVGHDRITSFHTLYFKIFEPLGAWIFMIFSTYVYRCATHKWLETAFICFYPRNGKIVLFLKIQRSSNISFSVYPELINFQKWFYSVRTVRQLFSGAFIVCVLEGNYHNELRDINFLSCSLDRDRIDNYSTTQTDVTKKYLFFFKQQNPTYTCPSFFCIIVLSERMRQN